MDDEAGAELEIVLRLRIELRANVIAPQAKRDAIVIAKIGSGTSLKCEPILATCSRLRNHVEPTNQEVHPRLVFAPCVAPRNAPATCVEEILGRVPKHLRAKRFHCVALYREPVIEEIAERSVYSVQVGVERNGAENHVLIREGKLKTKVLTIAKVEFRFGRGCRRRNGNGYSVTVGRCHQLNAFTCCGKSMRIVRLPRTCIDRVILRGSKASTPKNCKHSQNEPFHFCFPSMAAPGLGLATLLR